MIDCTLRAYRVGTDLDKPGIHFMELYKIVNEGIFKNPLSFTYYTLQVLFEVRFRADFFCCVALITFLCGGADFLIDSQLVTFPNFSRLSRPTPHQLVWPVQSCCDVVMEDCGEIVTC